MAGKLHRPISPQALPNVFVNFALHLSKPLKNAMSRTFAISDLHGCPETLRIIVENQLRPQPHDRFLFLGDYIDRGPDSKGVVDYIFQLQNAGFEVRALRGNHEALMLAAFESGDHESIDLWMRNGGRSTLDSFGISDVRQLPHRYLSFFESLDYYLELENCLLVHAGFNCHAPDPFAASGSTAARSSTGTHPRPNPTSNKP